MNLNERHRAASRAPRAAGLVFAGLLVATVAASVARAAPPPALDARAGLALAASAASAWAPDAYLTYVENDEPLDAGGSTTRWGYLFYSPSLEKSRAYSVRDGRILVAENLEMKLDAPPLTGGWLDSGAALSVAERAAGRAFREKHAGTPSTMLLMRGAFHEKEPDLTTWTVIYTSPNGPSLFVVVDAVDGKVRRTWRG